jgi:hypothetical protein
MGIRRDCGPKSAQKSSQVHQVPPILLLALVALCCVFLDCSGEHGSQEPPHAQGLSELWQIPEAAWQRPIGDYPPGSSGSVRPMEALTPPQCRTKRGIPVGGIGTGSFMLNLAGSFGPWELDIGGDDSYGSRDGSENNSGHEERFLAEAAFHVYEKVGGSTVVQTLATEDVLPGWPLLSRGQGNLLRPLSKGLVRLHGVTDPDRHETVLSLRGP